jgi:hypothetical protein
VSKTDWVTERAAADSYRTFPQSLLVFLDQLVLSDQQELSVVAQKDFIIGFGQPFPMHAPAKECPSRNRPLEARIANLSIITNVQRVWDRPCTRQRGPL